MIEISTRLDGKEIDLENIADEYNRKLIQKIVENLQKFIESLESLVCPIHGENPKIVLDIVDGRPTIGYENCCKELTFLVKEKIKE